jgi:hypothetical protein
MRREGATEHAAYGSPRLTQQLLSSVEHDQSKATYYWHKVIRN